MRYEQNSREKFIENFIENFSNEICHSLRYLKNLAVNGEKTRQKEEAEKKAIEACFRIRKMMWWQNTKIDSEKRRKFINDS